MNIDFKIEIVKYRTANYKKAVQLRHHLLRAPLGLCFSENDLLQEKEEQTIAVFNKNQIIAVLQLKPLDKDAIKLRQMAVSTFYQKKGIGKKLIKYSEKYVLEKGYNQIVLHARKTAVNFYKKLGYVIEGEEFMEIGLPHFRMLKEM